MTTHNMISQHVYSKKGKTKSAKCMNYISLNRPKRSNALTPQMLLELSSIFTENTNSPLIITGKGTSFCGGLDLNFLASIAQDLDELGSFFEYLINCLLKIFAHPHFTIAVVNGHAVGGGFALACCCDIIIATNRNAKLIIPGGQLTSKAQLVYPAFDLRIDQSDKSLDYRLNGLTLTIKQGLSKGIVDSSFESSDAKEASITDFISELLLHNQVPISRLEKKRQRHFRQQCEDALRNVKTFHGIF